MVPIPDKGQREEGDAMNLERGFRRIVVVLSGGVLLAGIAVDMSSYLKGEWFWVACATLRDGRQITEQVSSWEEIEKMRVIIDKLKNKHIAVFRDPGTELIYWVPFSEERPTPEEVKKMAPEDRIEPPIFRLTPGIIAVRVPWLDSVWSNLRLTCLSAGLAALFWVGFYVVRWTARGFMS